MELLHGPRDGLHNLGLATDSVGQGRGNHGVFRSRVLFAKRAENHQTTGKQTTEENDFTGPGGEETKETLRGHGCPFALAFVLA
jgi:hypothetical protein